MVVNHLLPRRPSTNIAIRWFMDFSLKSLFSYITNNITAKKLLEFLIVKRFKFKDSPSFQIGVIYEDEGKFEGVYRIYEEL